MSLTIIAAVSANGVIGANGALPWYLPEDLRHFREATEGRTILMGRKTFESLGGPLPKRNNVVISRTLDEATRGVQVYYSLTGAIEARRELGETELFIIGGRGMFAEGLKLADSMILTHIAEHVLGDTYFPTFSSADWQVAMRSERRKSSNGMEYRICHYRRKEAA